MLLGFIALDLIPISISSLLIYSIIYFCRKKYEGKKSFLCHFTRYLLIGYLLSLEYLTIFWGGFGYDGSYHLLNLKPFSWITNTYEMGYGNMIKQLCTNILMFVPYGILLPVVFPKVRKWWKTCIIIFSTTFLIEFVQYFIGRSSDIDDIIMNFFGGCVGYGLYLGMYTACKEKIWYVKMLGNNQ